jgi:hypothetical protein
MIHEALGRPVPVELTGDRRIGHRVLRLALVSLVALGLVWALASTTLETPPAVEAVLALGWVLMPVCLLWSVVAPQARYLLVVPASLVTGGLLAISVWWLPGSAVAATGWLLVTAGVALGGLLGLWLWFRVAPVPASLDDPYRRGRWGLIGIHVALIVVGWILAAAASLGP